jgi:hypothetical protein
MARILISCMIPLLNFQTGKLYEEVDEKLEAKVKYTGKTGKWISLGNSQMMFDDNLIPTFKE